MQIRRSLPIALAALLVCAATALAAGPVSLHPAKAGKHTRITIDLAPGASSQGLKSIAVSTLRGFKFDRRAAAQLCSSQQAQSNTCPAGSQVGGGTVNGHADGFPSGRYTFVLDVKLFLAPPQQSGDAAGLVVYAKDRTSPVEGHAIGRVVPLAHGPYGYQLRYDSLDSLGPSFPGVTVTIDKAHLSAAASRVVAQTKNGKTVNVRYSLVTNPATCKGSWAYRVRLGFSSKPPDVRNDSVACTS